MLIKYHENLTFRYNIFRFNILHKLQGSYKLSYIPSNCQYLDDHGNRNVNDFKSICYPLVVIDTRTSTAFRWWVKESNFNPSLIWSGGGNSWLCHCLFPCSLQSLASLFPTVPCSLVSYSSSFPCSLHSFLLAIVFTWSSKYWPGFGFFVNL